MTGPQCRCIYHAAEAGRTNGITPYCDEQPVDERPELTLVPPISPLDYLKAENARLTTENARLTRELAAAQIQRDTAQARVSYLGRRGW